MSISFLRISPKPFPPPFATLSTYSPYLSPSGSHGCQGSDSSRLPHEKCRSGGRRWRTDFQVWPRARPGPDDAPEFGYSRAVGSRQVLLEQAGGSETKELGIGLGGLRYSSSSSSHPDSPIITTLSSHYHHSSIGSQYLMAATTSIHFLPVVPKLLSLVVNIPKTRRPS